MIASVKSYSCNNFSTNREGPGREQRVETSSGAMQVEISPAQNQNDRCLWITANKFSSSGGYRTPHYDRDAKIILTLAEVQKLVAELVKHRLIDLSSFPEIVEARELLQKALAKIAPSAP